MMIVSCPNRALSAAAVLIATLALPAVSFAGGEPEEPGKTEVPCVHQVEKGETLSSISKKYLGTAGRWKEIAAANPQISNPNHITVGMTVELPCPSKTAAPTPAGKTQPAAAQTVPLHPVTPLKMADSTRTFHITERQYSFVLDKEYPAVGAIAGEWDQRKYFGQLDEVYLDIGEEDEIELRKGDRFTIYRDAERVQDPKSGLVLGHLNRILGDLEIVRVEKQSSVGQITNSYADIHPGDRLRAYVPLNLDIAVKENERKLNSTIIGSSAETFDLTDGRSFFIDKGSEDGVEIGNILTIYRPGVVENDPLKGKLITMPREFVGRAIVFHTEETTSTAWIFECTTRLQLGDSASLE